jgi:hypothetical protein
MLQYLGLLVGAVSLPNIALAYGLGDSFCTLWRQSGVYPPDLC